jgi:hypothetical protein
LKKNLAIFLILAALTLKCGAALAYFGNGEVNGAPGWKYSFLTVNPNTGFVSFKLTSPAKEPAHFFCYAIYFLDSFDRIVAETVVFYDDFKPKETKKFLLSFAEGNPLDAGKAHKLVWHNVRIEYSPPEDKNKIGDKYRRH